MKTNRLMAPLLVTCLMLATVAHAQTPPPLQDVNPNRHMNIAVAQASIRQAYDAISAAQAANHDRLGGHATVRSACSTRRAWSSRLPR